MREQTVLAVLLLLLVGAAPAWSQGIEREPDRVPAPQGGSGLVALQTAAPSCPDDSGDRYVDCDNGTVTDNETGLVWLKNADCFGWTDWYEAMAAVGSLSDLPDDGEACDTLTADECDCGLSDGSSPGEWRLASVAEWEVMVSPTCQDPALSDDEGTGCWNSPCDPGSSCSFYGVQTEYYWSSSSYVPNPSKFAWYVDLSDGSVYLVGKAIAKPMWPVRGGQ